MIEIEKAKHESRREKLAVEQEKVAAEKEKAEADKQLMSQMVQIMHTQTCMLTHMLGRPGVTNSLHRSLHGACCLFLLNQR